MARNEEDTDVAACQLLPDFVLPVGACLDVPICPQLENTVLCRRLQKRLEIGEPADFPVARLFGLVAAAVADKDDRLSRRAGHGSCSDNLPESLPCERPESS